MPGYSLIELTIVVGLVALLSVGIASVVLSSIVQSSRIRNQIKSRQAGEYTIGQMQQMIRNARTIASCDSAANNLTIVNLDGDTTTFLAETTGTSTRIASNSGFFLTPEDVTAGSSFNIACSPDDTNPTLVKISFDLKRNLDTPRETENPPVHFETSVSLRNN